MSKYSLREIIPAGLGLVVVLLGGCATPAGSPAAAGAEAFAFALIGDGPYGAAREREFAALIDDVNAAPDIDLVIHVGDAKGGGESCSDALLRRRFELFQQFDAAFVFTPGDNDWTDCHRPSNGGRVPTERLAFLRSLFYPEPRRTTGRRPVGVATQADAPGFAAFVENTRFARARVLFAQVHVVGSNNGLAPWGGIDSADTPATPRPDRLAEARARIEAAAAWIDAAFDEAERIDAAGVFVTLHANPRFDLPAADPGRAGFNAVLDRLLARARGFARPVLLAHGDFHLFLVDQPRFTPHYGNPDASGPADNVQVPNLTRVQTYGDSEVHWLRIEVDPDSRQVFSVLPRLVPSNVP